MERFTAKKDMEYSEFANKVCDYIMDNREKWIHKYNEDADILLGDGIQHIKEVRAKFRQWKPLMLYLSLGNIRNEMFSVRYLGQDIAKIKKSRNKIVLSVPKKLAKSNAEYFGIDTIITNQPWDGKVSIAFRDYFMKQIAHDKHPRQFEHEVESLLYSEFEKKEAFNKALVNIAPFNYCNCRFHIKTALAASKAKNNNYSISDGNGGDIDILCHRKEGKQSVLTVIEVKDENKKSESASKTIYQAICYSVFSDVLLRDIDVGQKWQSILNFPLKDSIIINAVAALPDVDENERYEPESIFINRTGDTIMLNYMLFTQEGYSIKKIRTSLK